MTSSSEAAATSEGHGMTSAGTMVETGRSSRSSRRSSTQDVHFTARPRERNANRVVERFKLRLRDALEQAIKKNGGVHHAIIREAFLRWDADASGKLNPEELIGALNRMGVRVSTEEAKVVVKFYDITGTGEMNYELLCKEIEGMSHPILSYIEEVDVLKGLSHTVREPMIIRRTLEKIRRGTVDAIRRAGHCKERSDCEADGGAVHRTAPRDLFMGTCLRFDDQDTGFAGKEDLRKVLKELRIRVQQSEVTALVEWFDTSSDELISIIELCASIFGTDLEARRYSASCKAPMAMYSGRRGSWVHDAAHPHQACASFSRAPRDEVDSPSPALPPIEQRRRALKSKKFWNEMAWNWQGFQRNWNPTEACEGNGHTAPGKESGKFCSNDNLEESTLVERACTSGANLGNARHHDGRHGSEEVTRGQAAMTEKRCIEKRLRELLRRQAVISAKRENRIRRD